MPKQKPKVTANSNKVPIDVDFLILVNQFVDFWNGQVETFSKPTQEAVDKAKEKAVKNAKIVTSSQEDAILNQGQQTFEKQVNRLRERVSMLPQFKKTLADQVGQTQADELWKQFTNLLQTCSVAAGYNFDLKLTEPQNDVTDSSIDKSPIQRNKSARALTAKLGQEELGFRDAGKRRRRFGVNLFKLSKKTTKDDIETEKPVVRLGNLIKEIAEYLHNYDKKYGKRAEPLENISRLTKAKRIHRGISFFQDVFDSITLGSLPIAALAGVSILVVPALAIPLGATAGIMLGIGALAGLGAIICRKVNKQYNELKQKNTQLLKQQKQQVTGWNADYNNEKNKVNKLLGTFQAKKDAQIEQVDAPEIHIPSDEAAAALATYTSAADIANQREKLRPTNRTPSKLDAATTSDSLVNLPTQQDTANLVGTISASMYSSFAPPVAGKKGATAGNEQNLDGVHFESSDDEDHQPLLGTNTSSSLELS